MDLAANLKPYLRPRQWRLIVWQRVKNGWRSSTANGIRRPTSRWKFFVKDHSGTYQLPFACRWIDGQWRNDRTGGMVEATVVGWRLPRSSAM
jgi:hypothetical protein